MPTTNNNGDQYSNKMLPMMIYKLHFDSIPVEQTLFDDDPETRLLRGKSSTEVMRYYLEHWPQMSKTSKNETIPMPKPEMRVHEDIAVVELQGARKRDYYETGKLGSIYDYPPSWVIMDNQHGLMAVQKSSPMGTADSVAQTLTAGFNAVLRKHGLELHPYIKTFSSEFLHEMVRREEKGDYLRQARLNIRRRSDDARLDTAGRQGEAMEICADWIESSNKMLKLRGMVEGAFGWTFDHSLKDEKASDVTDDITSLVWIMTHNGYDMTGTFSSGETISTSGDCPACLTIKQGDMERYIDSPTEKSLFGTFNAMEQWLDKAHETVKDYNDHDIATKRRKKRAAPEA